MQLNYKGIVVSYTDEGTGSALVLLHGFLENSTMWTSIKKALLQRNRVITVDLLGHGKTDCLGYVHSMDDMAAAVAAVLQHLRLRKMIFIGHSMGGYVALAFAAQFPGKMKGLCLLNSTTNTDSAARIQIRTRANTAAKKNYQNVVGMSIANLFSPESRALFPAAIAAAKTTALQTPLQGYIAAQEGMKTRKNYTQLLQELPCKKLFIAGEKDPVLPVASLYLETKETSTPLEVLSGGHMSHLENEVALIRLLQDFVK